MEHVPCHTMVSPYLLYILVYLLRLLLKRIMFRTCSSTLPYFSIEVCFPLGRCNSSLAGNIATPSMGLGRRLLCLVTPGIQSS